ncbi:MAG: DUF1554 domain-containing protein [Spirochaetes bacterium]|nr:DUF1554 domain-containing protein [Spirochaetota bacterium]
MKKILSLTAVLFIALILMTCERNEIYNNSDDDLLPFIGLGMNNSGPTAIYLYDAGQLNGNLGGRAGADAICQAAAPPPFPVTTVRAFISVSPVDTIAALVPLAYHGLPVYDQSGANIVSSSWSALWDGTIDMTLNAAGVLPAGLEWWNGSNTDGTSNVANCQGWTSDLAAFAGMRGNSNFPDAFWINWGTATCDLNINYLLCVAY